MAGEKYNEKQQSVALELVESVRSRSEILLGDSRQTGSYGQARWMQGWLWWSWTPSEQAPSSLSIILADQVEQCRLHSAATWVGLGSLLTASASAFAPRRNL